jgi:hypothetical protein
MEEMQAPSAGLGVAVGDRTRLTGRQDDGRDGQPCDCYQDDQHSDAEEWL